MDGLNPRQDAIGQQIWELKDLATPENLSQIENTYLLLALLKYPFYPMFNFDNGMNLISESLTILTSAQLLVVFAFAHIFWRYFIFAGF